MVLFVVYVVVVLWIHFGSKGIDRGKVNQNIQGKDRSAKEGFVGRIFITTACKQSSGDRAKK
jgi:hypothetical protein